MNTNRLAVQGFLNDVKGRNRKGVIWHLIFQAATLVGIVALAALLLNVMDGAFGYVSFEAKTDPATLAVDGILPEQQSKEQLVALLRSNLSSGAFNKLEKEKPFAERLREDVYQLVAERIIRYQVLEVWNLWPSLTQAGQIREAVARDQEHPNARLKFVSWLTTDFISHPQSSEALTAGVRTAILGSLWTILFTICWPSPSAWARPFTWKNTRATTGSTASSRPTLATWQACPRSCTGF